MKRIISLILSVCLIMTFAAGCGKKDRLLYAKTNLSKIVNLGKYDGIEIDKSSKEYKEEYDKIIKSDITNNNLFVKKTEGTVAKGDTANIDYVGKKDGVAFEGGSAKAFDLEIGSNQFIPGFETGLIGAKIGSTVDLNLTFPKEYNSPDLAGKAVVFTVTVNFVKTKEELKPSEYFKDLGYKSLEEYEKKATENASKNLLMKKFVKDSKVKEYNADDIEFLVNEQIEILEKNLKMQYGMGFEDYLKAMGQTKEQFKEQFIKEQIKPNMDIQMPIYALADELKIDLSQKVIDARIEEVIKEMKDSKVTAKELKDFYGETYFENLVATEKVLDYLYKHAKFK